jgi:hypothetical protein
MVSAFLKFVAWDATEHLQALLHFCRQHDAESALISAVEPKTLRSALHIGSAHAKISCINWCFVPISSSDRQVSANLLGVLFSSC